MRVCLVQTEAVTLIVFSFLWIFCRSCLEYRKYQWEKTTGARMASQTVRLCYFCAANCSRLGHTGCTAPSPVSSGSTKAIKERRQGLCFALYHLRASGLSWLEITLAVCVRERGSAVTRRVETMHDRDISAGEFLGHLVRALS